MSKHDKLIRRLLSKPKDFAWQELASLMAALGLELIPGSGSARKFKNSVTGQQLNIHQPHPSNILKGYQVRDIIDFLRKEDLLK